VGCANDELGTGAATNLPRHRGRLTAVRSAPTVAARMADPAPTPAQLRIVAFALFGGAAAFALAVPLLLHLHGGQGYDPVAALDLVGPLLAPSALVGALLLRARLRRRAEHAPPEQRQGFAAAATLVPLAMLEGAAIFNAVAWLLNGTAYPFVLAIVFALGAMVAFVPRTDDAPRAH